jgi:hypothetical protein
LRGEEDGVKLHACERDDLIRVLFELAPDADDPNWPPSTAETMWAEPVGVGRALLRNIPFFVVGVAYDDLVSLKRGDGADNGPLRVDRVVQHRGHSTYRVVLQSAADPAVFDIWWKRLEDLGCWYERANSVLVAIDMPQSVDVRKAYDILQQGEADGAWDFEEGFYSGKR